MSACDAVDCLSAGTRAPWMRVPIVDHGFTDSGFIEIEVEGHEQAVHDGAVSSIETQRPPRTCPTSSAIAGLMMPRRPVAGVPVPRRCYRRLDLACESDTSQR